MVELGEGFVDTVLNERVISRWAAEEDTWGYRGEPVDDEAKVNEFWRCESDGANVLDQGSARYELGDIVHIADLEGTQAGELDFA